MLQQTENSIHPAKALAELEALTAQIELKKQQHIFVDQCVASLAGALKELAEYKRKESEEKKLQKLDVSKLKRMPIEDTEVKHDA